MNCDAIAPYYETIERLAFGHRLQRHRTHFLSVAAHATKALVLGDGDGRFLGALSHAYPNLQIDSVELSAKMLSIARTRLQRKQVRFVQADALSTDLPDSGYHIIYSHFFLDCFNQQQANLLASKVAARSSPGASWVISEFRQAESGWRRIFTAVWLRAMYLFFRFATGLKQQQLPDYGAALQHHGFHLCGQYISMAGLIKSERWEFDPGRYSNPKRQQLD